VLLIVFCFGWGIRVADRFFVLGGGSVSLIVFCFGRGIRVAHRFLFWEVDPCCSSFLILGG
jgi:hypothetical protein